MGPTIPVNLSNAHSARRNWRSNQALAEAACQSRRRDRGQQPFFLRNNHAAMIAPEMTTPYQPSSTSCTLLANGRSGLGRAGSGDTYRQGPFSPDSAVRAYTAGSALEHEEKPPLPRPSIRCRLSKPTPAGWSATGQMRRKRPSAWSKLFLDYVRTAAA